MLGQMRIKEVSRIARTSLSGERCAFLVYDNWDDYGYKTTFDLVVFDSEGKRIDFGAVKICQKGMQRASVMLPDEPFDSLGEQYCSLGQEQNYYELFANIDFELRDPLLKGLRDCVYDPTIFHEFSDNEAMRVSLMRSIDYRTIVETFRGALTGQVSLTPFNFSYRFPQSGSSIGPESSALRFSVVPGSFPPTNIHAIIGRNSVGKTRLLWNITSILCASRTDATIEQGGTLRFESDLQVPANEHFSRLVTVAFSAFDSFRAPLEGSISEGDIHYSYIGLKKRIQQGFDREKTIITKSEQDLAEDFSNSLANCSNEPRLQRWRDSLALLESDPGFRDLGLANLMRSNAKNRLYDAAVLFQSLSSGHKIVLLTVTRLVELVDERTLVLVDEPESHLHPPLLASLIRILSMLLTRRNGAAILATHSPVVLQEMPKSCVWVLRRSGDQITAERPLIETFGENVGVLTREVFGLEVTLSGFHKLVSNAVVDERGEYDQVVAKFRGQLERLTERLNR
jgi:ABC-type cobalamin/Fe3+-siderophores transport system ATPase subunit